MKEYKIGRKTFGILLIVLGISIILQIIFKINVVRLLALLWPILLIGLGSEVLASTFRKEENLRYDVAGIMLSFIILFVGSFISLGIYAIDKVISTLDLKDNIVESMINDEYTFTTKNKLELINNDAKKIRVNIVENSDASSEYITVTVNADYDKTKTTNIFKALDSDYDVHSLFISDYDANIFIINEIPEYITNMYVTITTPSKNNITLKGEFE